MSVKYVGPHQGTDIMLTAMDLRQSDPAIWMVPRDKGLGPRMLDRSGESCDRRPAGDPLLSPHTHTLWHGDTTFSRGDTPIFWCLLYFRGDTHGRNSTQL